MKTPMPISGEEIQGKSLRLEGRRLIIAGSFLIHVFGYGSLAVISIWSVFFQSRQSSTSTSMSTRVMTAPLWSLENVRMRSSFIWIHAMFLHAKEYGDCFSFQCMRSFQMLSVFRFTFPTSKQSLGIQMEQETLSQWLIM